jgi:hypothetical protein
MGNTFLLSGEVWMPWNGANLTFGGESHRLFLAVEARCERITLLIVRKLNRVVDCISMLIINEPNRLVPMVIEPFAHRRHLVSKIRGANSNSNSAHSHPYLWMSPFS